MPQYIEILVPTKTGTRKETVTVVWLHLGAAKHKFALQYDHNGNPSILVDYRSGFVISQMASRMLAWRVGRGDFSSTKVAEYRSLAALVIADIVSSNGIEVVKAKLAAPPTLNA